MKITTLMSSLITYLVTGKQETKTDSIIGEWISDKSVQPNIAITFCPKGEMTFSINSVQSIYTYEFVSSHFGKIKVSSSVDNSGIAYFTLDKKNDLNIKLLTKSGRRVLLVKNHK
ncbi:hypothetical protein [Flavobacterium sp.]|uniref:hypothetical protein n=1 Tax=Flavobacterium sp. TaxID=239 RepID=UPI003D0C9D78